MFYLSPFAQLKDFDVVQEMKSYQGKPQVIYLTALWCKPCMDKLPDVISKFSAKDSINFIVLMDRHKVSSELLQKLKAKYDTSGFRFIPNKYYPSKRGFIQISPTKKVFDALANDFNKTYGTSYSIDNLWVGSAIVQNKSGFYVTKESEKARLLEEISSLLSSAQ
jgi:thiol-disulfide isomerase/thioredoxin